MRIRRQSAALRELAAEVVELLFGQTPFEKRARVDAGGGVPLVIHDVAIARGARPEKMIEADFVQRGGRGERRDVPADAGLVPVRAQHHRDRVPANQALDAALDLLAAGKRHFLLGRQGIHVRGIRAERQPDAAAAGMIAQLLQQLSRARGAVGLQDVVERIQPLAGFDRLEIVEVVGGDISHVFWLQPDLCGLRALNLDALQRRRGRSAARSFLPDTC